MGQHTVNIVYPINGQTFPKINPACQIKSAYFAASFSVTCGGGPHSVRWSFDGITRGKASFYDEFSGQFTWKLPAGAHVFRVESDCGNNQVRFKIG